MDQRTYKECDEGIGILLVNNFLQLPDFILVHGTEKDLLRVVGVRTVSVPEGDAAAHLLQDFSLHSGNIRKYQGRHIDVLVVKPICHRIQDCHKDDGVHRSFQIKRNRQTEKRTALT